MRNAFLILVAGGLLAACGQRGPLYLPDEERVEIGPVAVPLSSPIPRASPLPGQNAAPPASPSASPASSPAAASAAGEAGTVEEDEATRPNRN
jgi:hypothetical protein